MKVASHRNSSTAAALAGGTMLAAAVAVLLCAGCSSKPKPWREHRTVGPHFELVEWVRGTKDRFVPVGADIEGDRPGFLDVQPGLMGWMEDMEAGRSEKPASSEERLRRSGEPYGFTVEVTEAEVYRKVGQKLELAKKYEGDVRFWPSPDGRRLLQQKVWRDGPMEIVDAGGAVHALPPQCAEGLAPTFNRFPFAFVRWMPDSRHIVAISVHTAAARGYLFIGKWILDVDTGGKELVEERLLLLSAEVSDWRLVPIPQGAGPRQVQGILQKLTQDKDAWVRRAAQETLFEVDRRAVQAK